MSETVFCSVIFPANLPYFHDFINSLENQSDKDFTLLLFMEGEFDVLSHFKNSKLDVKIEKCKGSIPETRTQIFSFLKKSRYKYIIFGDTDDYFSENRVEVCKKLLMKYDIVANDLVLVSQDKKVLSDLYWKDRVELKQPISLHSIKQYNFLGLGNTAIHKKIIPDKIHFNSTLIAIDWYLFSVILQTKVKVIFSSDAFVYYRQHDANIVGRKIVTFSNFIRGIDVKLSHYQNLAPLNSEYKDLEMHFENIKAKLTEDNFSKLEKKNNIENPFWWEEIQL